MDIESSGNVVLIEEYINELKSVSKANFLRRSRIYTQKKNSSKPQDFHGTGHILV